jgi:hypothetical protein
MIGCKRFPRREGRLKSPCYRMIAPVPGAKKANLLEVFLSVSGIIGQCWRGDIQVESEGIPSLLVSCCTGRKLVLETDIWTYFGFLRLFKKESCPVV